MRVIEDSGLGRVLASSAASSFARRTQDWRLSRPWAPTRTSGAGANVSMTERLRKTVICGDGSSMGAPCGMPEVVSNVAGLSGLGVYFPGSSTVSGALCGELQDVLGPMGRALAEAKRLGASGVAVGDAQEFYDREMNGSTASNPWMPQKCRDLTNDAQVRLRALNSVIASAGGTPSAPPTVPGSGGEGTSVGGLFSDWTSTLRTGAIAAGVIAVVVVVAPIVWEAVAAHKMSRGR